MLIDSHTHNYHENFSDDFDEMIARAGHAGVGHFLMPAIDSEYHDAMHKTAEIVPNAYPMMGVHPCSINANFEEELKIAESYLFGNPNAYCAVGEIGIDLYWDTSTLDMQIEAFERQIGWAKQLNKPIVIHVRDAFEETIAVLDRLNDESLTGVFHCFTGTKAQADHILGYGGFKLGIGGVVTFKNGKIDQFIHEIELEHLILETDAPYLAPKPHRGKRNEPAYVRLVAEKLASCYGISMEEIEAQTTDNCRHLFNQEFITND
ncbi:MAG: TatD family hydrolase [Salibacteraceae bacterium]